MIEESSALESKMNNQIGPKRRYEAAIYTERDGCICMARFEQLDRARVWLAAQLETTKVQQLSVRTWVICDWQEGGKMIGTDGPKHLIKPFLIGSPIRQPAQLHEQICVKTQQLIP